MDREDCEEVSKLNHDVACKDDKRYKDKCSMFCSTRWRIAMSIFITFIFLYMHRVNLSLAVVCMVDTTTSDTITFHDNITSRYTTFTNNSQDVLLTVTNISDMTTYNGSFSTLNQQTDSSCGETSVNTDMKLVKEIKWNKAEISFLLSSYFYGSFFTQIPAGTLADRYGGKHIITITMTISGVCALVTPILARTSIILMFIIRVILGLAGGAVIPAGISMINRWSTPRERPIMIAFCGSGLFAGTVFTYLTSGLLCVYGFDNGWPSIFYIHGVVSLLFVAIWCCTAFNSPSVHPRLSQAEKTHIETCLGDTVQRKHQKPPWKDIFTSKPMWASIASHFSYNWSFFTVLINVPLFLKEVLKFEITSNGVYSSLPYIFQILASLCFSSLSEFIIKKYTDAHLQVRRIFNTSSLIGVAVCLVSAGYVTCETRYIAVILLCLSCVFGGVAYGGFFANHAEYSGQFTGTTFGITNAAGVISSILSSIMVGLLTPNGLQEEWRQVFYLAAAIDVFGAIVFFVCCDIHLQPWARKHACISIEVTNEQSGAQNIRLNDYTEPTS